jgi:uncharacterized membrane protein
MAKVSIESFLTDVFKDSWTVFIKDFVLYIIAGIITMLIGGITLGILMGPLMIGFIQLCRRRRNGENVSAGAVFDGLSKFLPAFLLMIVTAIGMIIGFFLLVIPGIVFGFFVSYALIIMAYRESGVSDSITASFEFVKTNLVHVLVLTLLLIIVNSVGSLVILGNFITFPFSILATTIAYEKLTGSYTGERQPDYFNTMR